MGRTAGEITVHAPGDMVVAIGDNVAIGFNGDKCHLFHENGEALQRLADVIRTALRVRQRAAIRIHAGYGAAWLENMQTHDGMPLRHRAAGQAGRSSRRSASARPAPGQVVLGSTPISRAFPHQGGSCVPPSSYQSQTLGKTRHPTTTPRRRNRPGGGSTSRGSKSCERRQRRRTRRAARREIDDARLSRHHRPSAAGARLQRIFGGS